MASAWHVVLCLLSALIMSCGKVVPGSVPRLVRGGWKNSEREAVLPGQRLLHGRVGGALRLRGGLDAVQLHEFEALLDCLQRPDATPQQRQHAQQFALSLQNPVDLSEVPQQGDPASRRQGAITKRLSQLQHILDCSHSPTAQVVACNSLTALATNHWDNNTLPHVEMRNYALSFLFAQCSNPTVPSYVSRAMTRMLSRITKLGWIECEAHRGILTQLERFFDATARHYATGLTILLDLVEEMDLPATTRRGAIQRRQFMLTTLHSAFTCAMDTLLRIGSMADPEQAALLSDAALQLAIQCLTFDFTGQKAGGEDDSDEINIPIPMSWRKDVNNPKVIDLLWNHYQDSVPPQSSRSLELLMLYTSVPRALHESQEMHLDISKRFLEGIRNVMQHGVGLDHADNYHMFCRVLGSLRDLSPLTPGHDHDTWVELASNFTVRALHDVFIPQNSLHFLLNMWSKLSTSASRKAMSENGPGRLLAHIMSLQTGQISLDQDESNQEAAKAVLTKVNHHVSLIVVAYLEGRLEAISGSHEGVCEDPLEDPEMLQEQLEILPRLCGDQYSEIAQNLLQLIDRHMEVYRTSLVQGRGGLARLEGQLAWLVRVCAALIGGHYVVEHRIQIDGSVLRTKPQVAPNMRDGDQLTDADVTGRVLQLVLMLQRDGERVTNDARLELALLSFLDQLKQGLLYVESAMDKDQDDESSNSGQTQALPSFLMSLMGKRPQPSLPAEIYRGIFKRIGLGDHKAVMGIVLSKIVYNLRVWGDNQDVIRQTLLLLATMVQAGLRQPSGQMLLTLEVTQNLLAHHSPKTLPFLLHPGNERYRTMLYLTLSQLLAMETDDVDASGAFDRFLAPFLHALAELKAADEQGALRTEEARLALIGAARDLRGVVAGSTNQGLAHILFDALYPAYLPLFTKGLDVWYDDPGVTTSVLKLWQELAVLLNSDRTRFPNASPAPQQLFRQLCASLQAYGARIAPLPVPADSGDAYKRRYKGIGVSMSAFATAVSGDSSGLGALALFGDTCLHDTSSMLIHFALGMPWHQLMAFPKVATAYYSLVEALLNQCMEVFASFDTVVVVEVLGTVQRGLANALQHKILIQCAKAIDHFGAFLFRNKLRQSELALRVRRHLDQVPTLVSELQALLIRQVLSDEHTDIGIMSHPLLSLILADDAAYTLVWQKFVSRQRGDLQQNCADAFKELMIGIARNLEIENRRKFLRNVQAFRTRLRPWDELIFD